MNNYCLVCEVELGKYETELCSTCFSFFNKKYKKGIKKELSRFRQNKAFLEEWRSQSTEKEVKE
jgi:hypothetical protein